MAPWNHNHDVWCNTVYAVLPHYEPKSVPALQYLICRHIEYGMNLHWPHEQRIASHEQRHKIQYGLYVYAFGLALIYSKLQCPLYILHPLVRSRCCHPVTPTFFLPLPSSKLLLPSPAHESKVFQPCDPSISLAMQQTLWYSSHYNIGKGFKRPM